MRGGFLRQAWRFARDRRGVAALEFALVVPIVIVVYAAGFEIAEAATVYRKLTDTTVQLANVTAQYTSMTTTDTSSVMSASSQIMSPYSTSPLTIILSEVTTNAQGAGTITWSQALNTTALAKGASVTLPSGFQAANSSYILVQTTYAYTPIIGSAFVSNINMSNQIFMLPRQSTSIPCSGC